MYSIYCTEKARKNLLSHDDDAEQSIPLVVISYESKDSLPKGLHVIIFVPNVF